MGSFFECKVEPNYKTFEIACEIRKVKDDPSKKNEKNLNNFTSGLDKNIIFNNTKEKSEPKDIKIGNEDIKEKNNINNAIIINNSNVTINKNKSNNRIDQKELIEEQSKEETNELEELFNSTSMNKNLISEEFDYQLNKGYYDQLYSEQSAYDFNISNKNEDDEKIINKIKEIKEKLTNKNSKKKKYRTNFNNYTYQRTSKSMNNKQIKKNIPNYRKRQKTTLLSGIRSSKSQNSHLSLENSLSKSINSSLFFQSIGDPFYHAGINKHKTEYKIKKKKDVRLTQMYLNYSTMNNVSGNSSLKNNNKAKNKEKDFYQLISKNIIDTNKSSNNISPKKAQLSKKGNSPNEMKFNLLYDHYRDIIEIYNPKKFLSNSLVDKSIISSEINEKIILTYNKLNNFNIQMILYDGNLFKIIKKKDIGFKASKRYFQVSKNCFRYYTSITEAKTESDKPMVQFDIRYINELHIIEHSFLKSVKIDGKDIKFVFFIRLNQNDDFFVFAVDNEDYGNSVFSILTLLKNFYEDKNK
jgi:hypothetical protein